MAELIDPKFDKVAFRFEEEERLYGEVNKVTISTGDKAQDKFLRRRFEP